MENVPRKFKVRNNLCVRRVNFILCPQSKNPFKDKNFGIKEQYSSEIIQLQVSNILFFMLVIP